MPVRIGVIGVGYLGRHHARIYSELEEAELVAVSDVDSSLSKEISTRYGCRAYRDYTEMLESCDALSIATPTTTHYKIAMECIGAGKDVLIEKPITDSIETARAIVEAAGQQNVLVQVGHLERYNPATIAAAGLIHTPRFIEAERLSPFLGRGTDVDVTLDLMIHDIDIILSIARSRLKEVRAVGESVITDRLDVAKAWLEFENGTKALVTASRLSQERKRTMRVFQSDCYLWVDYQNQEVRRHYKTAAGIAFETIKPETKEPLREELRDFAECVAQRRKPGISGAEASEALETVLRITEIARAERN